MPPRPRQRRRGVASTCRADPVGRYPGANDALSSLKREDRRRNTGAAAIAPKSSHRKPTETKNIGARNAARNPDIWSNALGAQTGSWA